MARHPEQPARHSEPQHRIKTAIRETPDIVPLPKDEDACRMVTKRLALSNITCLSIENFDDRCVEIIDNFGDGRSTRAMVTDGIEFPAITAETCQEETPRTRLGLACGIGPFFATLNHLHACRFTIALVITGQEIGCHGRLNRHHNPPGLARDTQGNPT